MPEVTVCPSPKGLPTATTKSPTCRRSEFATGTSVRRSAFTLITATSDSRSAPTSLAWSLRPSVRVTVISSALSTTWLLVST
jgi:hypothetical protein